MAYQPVLKLLRQHPLPDWFNDAKLGIFIHWGPYSVPGWAPLTGEQQEVIARRGWTYWFTHNPYAEWYLNSIRIQGSPSHRHHVAAYGVDFSYDEFIPRFDQAVANMDPDAWADLFASAGARYVVLVTKHHDGFTLWPSQHRNPHKPGYHAERDLVGEVAQAVRARGMRMGLYYSGGLDWTFDDTVIRHLADLVLAIPQGADYVSYAQGQMRELIDRYQPAVLWNDIGYPAAANLKELFAYYYNAVPDGVINDRFAQMRVPGYPVVRAMLRPLIRLALFLLSRLGRDIPGGVHYDFQTTEYASHGEVVQHKWEATRGLGYSFGYNWQEGPEHLLSVNELVRAFVDIVSKNGNLLLNVGPMADGTIPAMQRERLWGLGKWLSVNGEAVFGTRPWVTAEGLTSDGKAVRFTQKGDALYAVLLDTLPDQRVSVESLVADPNTSVCLLGVDAVLRWAQDGNKLTLTLPECVQRASECPAYAFRIVPRPRRVAL